MNFTKLALAAAASLFVISSASAAPLVTSQPTVDNPLIQVQHRRHAAPPHRHHGHRYVPGRRYSTAPRGWRRYGARPGDWRTRGCVMAGPVWFCP